MAKQIQIGQVITVGWNGAKHILGDSYRSNSEMRVEAVGIDWIVLRDCMGCPQSGTFTNGETHEQILAALAG